MVLALLVVGAGAGAFLALRDDEDRPATEAGSSFGGGDEEAPRSTALLDALAPLLASDQGERRAAPTPPPAGDDEDERVRLPLPAARAAARLFLVGFAGTSPDAPFFTRLRARGWGGVVLERGNAVRGPQAFGALARRVREVAREAGQGAPLVAAVQDGTDATALRSLPPRAPVETADAGEAERDARAAGRRLRGLGVALDLAPPASLGSAGGPWEGLAFGDEPGVVGDAVRAAVDGYRAGGVAAVVGRFPGEGAASQDPSAGAATVGLALEDLRANDLVPFRRVARRAAAIQMSPALYAAWDGVTPATLLPEAVRELRGTGFDGVVVSADLAVTTLATGGSVGDAAVRALQAGCDLLWVPGDRQAQEDAYRAVLAAIRRGDVETAHVADALKRIAALKRRFRIR